MSRPIRRIIGLVGLLGLLVTIGIGVYFAGRVRGADEGRAAAQAAAAGTASGAAATTPLPTVSVNAASANNVAQAFHAAYGVSSPALVSEDDTAYSYEPVTLDHEPGLLSIDRFKVLVTSGTSQEASRPQGAFVSAHYFEPDGATLRLWRAFPQVAEAGNAGTLNTITLRRDLLPNPVLLVTGSGMEQGCASTWTHLVELTPTGAVNRGSVLVGFSYNDADFDGTLVADGAGFAVNYKGSFNKKVTFSKHGETYAPTTDADELAGC